MAGGAAVLLMQVSQTIAKHMPDCEIIELHHDKKLDAPSGTAIRTADLITEADNEHVARAIAKILDDPNALAARNAWREAVDRGEALFNDTKLGATGKSCASCHSASSLRNVEDAYPKFDPVRKRFVDLNEAINYMIQERMKGTPLPPNDQRYFDLLAYIKTLK